VSYTDDETRTAIAEVFEQYGYLMCPHTAIGYMGIRELLSEKEGEIGLFLSTAHPAKFVDIVEPLIGDHVQIPERLNKIVNRKKNAIEISGNYDDLKEYLLDNF
jgi:threonine synthase